MDIGNLVNVSDIKSDLYCKTGEILYVDQNKRKALVMFKLLVKVAGCYEFRCVADLFEFHQLYEIKNIKRRQVG
ncbi:hypothetical protein Amet_2401 [Alkaliphilus metalliredigens QYMF]|uniref:Uncharacterized protein n=1 Tax=Alkaliphilus metalliredigens (strain QYMF) TaxID=293826 RepID=A6TQT7_ALKMQ|nr:hypothetical protein [Alkaliphilus metalliredigens]ABR48555.1 hypothetical protein Amet_2401 [Alkaliphilus metalliredigens QYMF]